MAVCAPDNIGVCFPVHVICKTERFIINLLPIVYQNSGVWLNVARIFKKKKTTLDNVNQSRLKQKYKLLTVYLSEYSKKPTIGYFVDDINPTVDWQYILEGAALALDHLVKYSKKNKLKIPKQLNNYSYDIEKASKERIF